MTGDEREAPPVTEEEIEEVVCPRCFANTWEPCVTPSGDFAAAMHVSRVRKAESIAEDLATLGYLPEHGPEADETPPARTEPEQPAEDEPTRPEPAVARGRAAARDGAAGEGRA